MTELLFEKGIQVTKKHQIETLDSQLNMSFISLGWRQIYRATAYGTYHIIIYTCFQTYSPILKFNQI